MLPVNAYSGKLLHWLLKMIFKFIVGGQLANGNTNNLSSPYQIVCSNLNIADFDNTAASIQIIPNPTSDSFRIAIEETIHKIELYDISGRLIKSWSNEQYLYSLSGINSGVYSLFVYSDKSLIIKKIIKK